MQVRTHFPDLFLTNMLPLLDEVIFTEFNPMPPQFSKIFRVMKSTRSAEQTTQVAGLGLPVVIPENGPMQYDSGVPGFNKTYVHDQVGLGFRASRIMADDDKHSLIRFFGEELGRSMREYIEIRVAAHFNNGFTTNGFDGQPLFSTSHPLVKAGGVQSNRLAVASDLDIPAIELMLTDFRLMVDHTGKKIRVPAEKLVIPPQLEFAAAEILAGTWRSDTSNRTVNAFRHRDRESPFTSSMVWDYLTDPDAWFICGPKERTQLRFYWREKPGTVHDVDFDTRAIKTAMWMRYSSGWNDFYGVMGSPGA